MNVQRDGQRYSLFERRLSMRVKSLSALTIAACLATTLAFADGDNSRTYQTANIFLFGSPAVLKPGGATLLRSRQRVEMRIATSGLNMNSSYTVWWVVFNNPSGCVGGCGPDDLTNPAARASVFYAAGFVTGLEDSANVSAHLDAGALPGGLGVRLGHALEDGNGLAAAIHLVVRTHGVTTPGVVDKQIGSFNGGCSPTCSNEQAAMFPPVASGDEE